MELAAVAAAALVPPGAVVGLGTGATVGHLLPLLAARHTTHVHVATSSATERIARDLGLEVRPFEGIDRLDVAIDGADQVAPDGWLVKGGGGAHTREKVVAAAADRFIVIASSNKLVSALRPPVPVELLEFGAAATLRSIAPARLRGAQRSPDGGLIADYFGDFSDPRLLDQWLSEVPGIIGHGLFAPELVTDIIVAEGTEVTHRRLERPG
jgi:ribose 5-phosphate isomerase A